MNSLISFPYKAVGNDSFPIIPISLQGPSGVIETEAFVDSGASTSVFLPIVAEQIGIDYRRGKRNYTMLADGRFICFFLHVIPVSIGGIDLNARIGFAERLMADFNILGQKDIFDRFMICFFRPARTLYFRTFNDRLL